MKTETNKCGIVSSNKTAFKWFKMAADNPSSSFSVAEPQWKVGWMYAMGEGVRKNIDKSIFYLLKWAENTTEGNHMDNLDLIGYHFYEGKNVDRDYKKALICFLMSSKMGSKFAKGKLGEMYLKGWGVSVDYKKAFKYLKKACGEK